LDFGFDMADFIEEEDLVFEKNVAPKYPLVA
jgi:hypothetical protein